MPGIERKLTTIVAADAVGFSRLMDENEAATLAALNACRAIIDAAIAEHHVASSARPVTPYWPNFQARSKR